MTREEAIKVINNHLEHWKRLVRGKVCDEIEGAETISAFEVAIQALSQEPCTDAVSRQAVLDCLTATGLKKYDFILNARTRIKALPPVTQKSKTGHWISCYDEDTKGFWYECDRCHAERAFNTVYCPDCGCRMVATQEREE
jgi:hypothetical protein